MKKIIYYSFIIVALGLFSCSDDFLETTSPSKLSSETVFKTPSMAKAAIMGVYGKMTDTYIYGQKLSVNWQGVSDIETNSGFSTTGYNSTSSDSGAGNFYDDPYNQTTKWQTLYEFAELASTAVDGIRNSPIFETRAAEMKPLLGEALTLRAMAYFELVKYWGDVPFKREASKSDLTNVYMGKTDRDTIYAGLVEDLTEAVDYLPWLKSNAEYSTSERISKAFAKGLLAKVALYAGGWSLRDGNLFPDADVEHHPTIQEENGYYVGRVKNWRDYYQIAAQQTAEILGSSAHPHALDPSYENIWKTVCSLQQNTYNENLFEVAFGLGNNGDIGSLMGYEVAGNTKYGSRGFGGSYVASQAYYFYSFDRDDLRRDVTLTWTSYGSANKETMKTDALNVSFAKWRIYWMAPSYLALHKTANSRIATGVNWILMRYSDIYLMFAEAQSQLTSPDAVNTTAGMSPRQALEKVRERAFGAGSPKIKEYDANFFNAIVNERAWEFGCESIRKGDLCRWGLLYEKIETMKKTLCLMLDNKVPVTIFDKTYQPSDFPQTIYYKFKDAEFIDQKSINFYTNLGASPGTEYQSASWFTKSIVKPTSGTSRTYLDNPTKVLLAATGINKAYDYSSFLSSMTNGGEIQANLAQYTMGNKNCNYRQYFAIYYEDVFESKGFLTNSYGY
ncbi:RagB/SusD family nutrient uptake outer membrane protein [Flavobacterium commune]|uniref:RagB/SusD family nutrient uptake outer membrane protein n=1 Tax=Flavobacterium commune TaxID=1306519 RepID=A0A1D9PCQ0_9FLAO|nr:RagB/SusD family nutrient uptake outer membrane protein [Flavobacterium commune]APA00313.1 RagB/SusD family nutrient uptake outer membrane protein [Flavobacterium commune]